MQYHTHDLDVISAFCRLNMNTRKELPIRPSEMGLLILVVTSEEQLTPVEAAHYFQISKPMVTAMVRSLLKAGYIVKHPSAVDGRSYRLVATQQGADLVAETFGAYSQTMQTLIKGMGKKDYEALIVLLEKANQILLEEKNNG